MKCALLLSMSYFEIYNEKVFDLMDPQGVDPLEVRESRSKQFFIQGLTERLIPDMADGGHGPGSTGG